MNYHLKTINKKNYLQIIFFGTWNRQNGKQIMNDIFSKVTETNNKKVLLDFRQSDYMETSTLMDYDEAITAAGFPNIIKYKFASLHRPEEVNRFLFWETVAVNRGIRIKFFKQEKDATEWLINNAILQ